MTIKRPDNGKPPPEFAYKPPETLLTLDAAAEYLQVTPRTLREWARRGEVPAGRIGGRGDYRFRRADLEHYAYAGAVNQKADRTATADESMRKAGGGQ